MRVTVVGAGVVGLVTAAGFAAQGHHVTVVDRDAERIRTLSAGSLPVFEPGLASLVAAGVAALRLGFATTIGAADVVFVAVGTPVRPDGTFDATAVFEVADNVPDGIVLVIKSTVPVGTHALLRERLSGRGIEVVSNPEFLREGSAVEDMQRPDRIVIGGRRGVLAELYEGLADRILWMDPASAELTKLVANTMLAMRISFMNDIAVLCERVRADVTQVRAAVGADHRIGPHHLDAGAGYGGSCLPKDVVALVATARAHGLSLALAEATHAVNLRQAPLLLDKLARHFDHDLRGRQVAVWGVAFKPDTDDLREAPALGLIAGLVAGGAEVRVHDPAAGARLRGQPGVAVFESEYDAATGADAMVLVTGWRQYMTPDFDRLSRLMRGRVIVDGRNLWAHADVARQGFLYEGVGV
jgi:UDPglucose 6-dehydrogenase